jgi:hypothetical protein
VVEEAQSLWIDAARHPLGLRVHIRGEENFGNAVAYWNAIARYLRLTGARNLILFDELDGAALAESDWLELVSRMDGLGLEQVRIAHVKPRGANAYCELFARGAGYDTRVFTREQDAERWLAGA